MSALDISLDGEKSTQDLTKAVREFFPKLYRGIVRDMLPPLQRTLDRVIDSKIRPYPPRNKVWGGWSKDPEANARGRRGYYARHKGPYVRTGDMGKAWVGDITFDDGLLETSIRNDSPGASYVFGDQPHGYEQVPGHKLTGWQPGNKLVEPEVLNFALEVDSTLDAYLDDYIERL